MLLAVEANRVQPNVQARSSLFSALLTRPTLRRTLHGLRPFPQAVEYSPDGALLAVEAAGGVQLWDATSGRAIPLQPALTQVQRPVFRPDGKVLALVGASASGRETARLVDVGTGKLLEHQPKGSLAAGYGFDLAFSPDGTVLAVSHPDGIALYNASTGEALRSFAGASQAMAFSPDGSLLATAAFGGADVRTVSVHEVGTGTLRRAFTWTRPKPASAGTAPVSASVSPFQLAFGVDGSHLMLRDLGKDVAVAQWDITSGALVAQNSFGPSVSTTEGIIAVSKDGRLLASRDADGVQLWDAVSGAALGGRLPAPTVGGMISATFTASFSPDGSTLAVGADDGSLRLWSTNELPPLPVTRVATVNTASNPAGVALGATGEVGAVTSAPSTIDIFDVRSSPSRRQGSIDASADWNLIVSPDSRVLVTTEDPTSVPPGAAGGHVRLWDVGSRRSLGPLVDLPPGCQGADAAGVSSDDRLVAIACRSYEPNIHGAMTIWDVRGRRRRAHWPITTDIDHVSAVAFSPDGRKLALAGNLGNSGQADVRLWDVASGRRLQRGPGTAAGSARALAFSPDGRTLAFADERHIALWDVARGRLEGGSLAAPSVRDIAFSPDGKTVAASGGGVSLWDVESGLPIGRPLTMSSEPSARSASAAEQAVDPSHGVVSSAFDRSGRWLLAASVTSTGPYPSGDRVEIVRWDLRPSAWIHVACRVANRQLTSVEWKRYVGTLPYRPACRSAGR